jgi:hypothetical protein
MNSKERALTAFAHQEADHVPIFELTIDNPTAEYVLGRSNLCGFGGKARGLAYNQAVLNGSVQDYFLQRKLDEMELWEKLDLDVYPHGDPAPRNPAVPDQISERQWKITDEITSQWVIYDYSAESDVYDMVDSSLRQGGLPELEKLTAHLESQSFDPDAGDFSFVDMVLERMGKNRMVLASADVEIGSTFDWAETFLIGLVEAPDLIHRYLDARLKTTLKLTEMLLERGVHGIHGGYDWAANKGPIFSPRHFRKFVFPRMQQITDLCHRYGVPYIKHTDGNVNSLLEDMIASGIDAFQAIEPRANMNITEIKQKYGDRLTLIGNVDCSTVLVDGPIEAVKVQTQAVIQAAAPGGGFLISSSNSIHPGVKPEYYLAMLETAREVGTYPIQSGGN